MCSNCKNGSIARRDLLKAGAASFLALGLGGVSRQTQAADGSPTKLSPDEALSALKAGNERYVTHPELCTVNLAQQRSAVAGHQAPWATIVSCSDSRVPSELIFGGQGLGELFVARNAGNLVDTATIGTVEYGAAVLGTPLVVILAHTSCGAVKAACEIVTRNATFPSQIAPMVEPILPAALAVQKNSGDFVTNAAKENAKRTAARLIGSSSLIAGLIGEGKLRVTSAIYNLQTGVVSYLD